MNESENIFPRGSAFRREVGIGCHRRPKKAFSLKLDSDEGVPLAVARKAFGSDPKPIIEELNEVLVA